MQDLILSVQKMPERIFVLCKAIEAGLKTKDAIEKILEPSEQQTIKYCRGVINAAKDLHLLNEENGILRLLVSPEQICTMDNLRLEIIKSRELYRHHHMTFVYITKAYMNMNDEIFKYDSISSVSDIICSSAGTGERIKVMDIRAWRFWARFLGMGYFDNTILVPNEREFILDIIRIAGLENNSQYSIRDFIKKFYPYGEMGIADITDNKLNLGFSNGLRSLHDSGFIELKRLSDFKETWHLFGNRYHSISDEITHILVKNVGLS